MSNGVFSRRFGIQQLQQLLNSFTTPGCEMSKGVFFRRFGNQQHNSFLTHSQLLVVKYQQGFNLVLFSYPTSAYSWHIKHKPNSYFFDVPKRFSTHRVRVHRSTATFSSPSHWCIHQPYSLTEFLPKHKKYRPAHIFHSCCNILLDTSSSNIWQGLHSTRPLPRAAQGRLLTWSLVHYRTSKNKKTKAHRFPYNIGLI